MSALTERLREPLCDEWFRARLLRQGLSLYELAMYVKAVEAERQEAASALEAAGRLQAMEACATSEVRERLIAAEARAEAAEKERDEARESLRAVAEKQPWTHAQSVAEKACQRLGIPYENSVTGELVAAVGARQEPPPATPIARVEGDWVAAEARQKPPPAAVLDPVDVAYPGLTADSAAVPPEAT